tara:strand:+ start:284 stop:538 length:255 start_codon:yes stop_codon:yes gene_type:complete
MSESTSDLITQIDIEIEACQRAIRKAHSAQEVEDLSNRVKELIKQRFVAYNLNDSYYSRYPNHLPRLIKEIEDRSARRNSTEND